MEASMSTPEHLEVVAVERIDGIAVIVEFSDSTWASYPAQELAALRPERETTTSLPDTANGGQGGDPKGGQT
jgi:hypothetical protein